MRSEILSHKHSPHVSYGSDGTGLFENKLQKEIFLYICQNDGPDNERRAHPVFKTVSFDNLMPALKAAKDTGFCCGIKPYHFNLVKSLWLQDQWVDEIVLKRVDTLLYGKYAGNFLRFCGAVQAKELLQPLEEVVRGKTYRISVAQPLGAILRSSPFDISMRYLDIINERSKYPGLRPFHFNTASQGTFHDQTMALEVVKRKIQSLLRKKYGYNFARLCASTNQIEFMQPFIDPVGKGKMLVSVGAAAQKFDNCLYQMLCAYIKSQGIKKQFAGFKPYHMSTASQATYQDKRNITEVLVESCRYQIATTYLGDESAFLKSGILPQICQPFFEKIATRMFKVHSATAVKIFGESSVKIKKLYLRERDRLK